MSDLFPPSPKDPQFHEGELFYQEQAQARELVARYAKRGLRDFLLPEHQEFFAELPFVVVGSTQGKMACIDLLCGPPGFITAPDQNHLLIQRSVLQNTLDASHLAPGDDIALLGIQPATRRRNRENGWLVEVTASHLLMRVAQSYGNCPKYITQRVVSYQQPESTSFSPGALSKKAPPIAEPSLTVEMKKMIGQADTFFIATHWGSAKDGRHLGADVSHRGGAPGFVRVESSTKLSVEDYPGNNMFNTLGNLYKNGSASLLFIDPDTSCALRLDTVVTIKEPASALTHVVPEAARLVAARSLQIEVKSATLHSPLPLRFSPLSSFR